MAKSPILRHVDEETAAKVAYIIGENSAYARAIAELARRRSLGEDVHLFSCGNMVLVGPWPDEMPRDLAT